VITSSGTRKEGEDCNEIGLQRSPLPTVVKQMPQQTNSRVKPTKEEAIIPLQRLLGEVVQNKVKFGVGLLNVCLIPTPSSSSTSSSTRPSSSNFATHHYDDSQNEDDLDHMSITSDNFIEIVPTFVEDVSNLCYANGHCLLLEEGKDHNDSANPCACDVSKRSAASEKKTKCSSNKQQSPPPPKHNPHD
jgi:hypothetical protein